MNIWVSKMFLLLVAFIIMNISVILMPLNNFFYIISILIFALPIILSSYEKTISRVQIDTIEMNPKHVITKIKTNRPFRFFIDIIRGICYGFVLPVMTYLMDLSEYVSIFLLISIMLFINKCILKGRAYKKEFVGRSENGRRTAVAIMEVVIYPVLWITLNNHLSNTYLFGTLEDLEGIPRFIGLFVDMMNQLIRTLSENSSSTIILFLLVLLVNGGILFIGFYKFFDGFLLEKTELNMYFSSKEYAIIPVEIPKNKMNKREKERNNLNMNLGEKA